jgi:hypothetical protein
MKAPTQEQLLNYIAASIDFYERVKGPDYALPISKSRRYLLLVVFMCHLSVLRHIVIL